MPRYFHEELEKQQEELALSLQESRRAKAERTQREMNKHIVYSSNGSATQLQFPFIDNEKDELEDELGVNHGRTT